MNILFIADIVGEEMLDIIFDILPRLRRQNAVDLIIANVENVDKGKGILPKQVERLKAAGIDCLTSGNHIWEPKKREVLIAHAGYLLRPLNYPDGNIGIPRPAGARRSRSRPRASPRRCRRRSRWPRPWPRHGWGADCGSWSRASAWR